MRDNAHHLTKESAVVSKTNGKITAGVTVAQCLPSSLILHPSSLVSVPARTDAL